MQKENLPLYDWCLSSGPALTVTEDFGLKSSLFPGLKFAILPVLAVLLSICSYAQLSGVKTVGLGGDYNKIADAVTAINAQGLSGNLELALIEGYANTGEAANNDIYPISMPTHASLATYSVKIYPTFPGIIIGNNLNTSARITGVFNFNGSKNVTIDGRLYNSTGGGNYGPFDFVPNLVINDTSTTTTAGEGYAVQFTGGASNNTLQYVNLRGRANSTSSGVVQFMTAAATGNNNNTLLGCDITTGSTSGTAQGNGVYPYIGIYSAGTSATPNTGNTVSGCNIYDYFNPGGTSSGIHLTTGSGAWTLTANSFYQTGARTVNAASAVAHSAIYVVDSLNSSGGGGNTITNNFIGGNAAGATGSNMTYSGTGLVRLIGISAGSPAGRPANIVQGNIVRKITESTGIISSPIFAGIWITKGDADLGGSDATKNVIGDSTTTGSIVVTHSNTTAATTSYGIFYQNSVISGSSNFIQYIINIKYNVVSGITINGSATNVAANFSGIAISTYLPVADVSYNLVGSMTVSNSIDCASAVTTNAQTLNGISLAGTTANVSSSLGPVMFNRVANMRNLGVSSSGDGVSIAYGGSATRGIFYNSGLVGNIVSNLVFNISSATTNSSLTGGLFGIYNATSNFWNSDITDNVIFNLFAINTFNGQTLVTGIYSVNNVTINILRNRIFNLANAATGTATNNPPLVVGVHTRNQNSAAVVTIANNMITLGTGQSTNTQFIGLLNSLFVAGTINYYYNSVLIQGTAASGSHQSFGFYRTGTGTGAASNALTGSSQTPVDLKNNILANQRNGGTGKHYAVGNNSSSPNTGFTSDYNALNAASTTIARWGLTTAAVDQTFAAYKTASGTDAGSLSGVTVNFVNPTTGDLHINTATATQLESAGTVVSSVTTDYDLEGRPMTASGGKNGGLAPDLGADEFNGDILDLAPPVITYTAITNTSFTGNRSLVNFATVTDNLGVEVTFGFQTASIL